MAGAGDCGDFEGTNHLIHGRLTTRNNDDDGTYPCFTCDRAAPSHTPQELLLQWCKTQVYNFKTTQPVVHIGVSRVTELLLQCCKAQVKTQCCKADGAYLPTATTTITRTARLRTTTARGTYNLASQHTISPHNRTLFPALAVAIASNCGSGKSAVAATTKRTAAAAMASTAASATAATAQPHTPEHQPPTATAAIAQPHAPDCLIRPPCQIPQTAKPHATLAGKHGGSYCECGNCPQLSMATAHDQPWTHRSSHDCTINASSGSNYRTRNTNPLVASQRRGGLCKHRRASRCNSSGGSSCGSRIWGKSNHLAGLAKVA